MDSLPLFLVRIVRAARRHAGDQRLFIVVHQSYAYLEEQLRQAFEGQEDVRVVVDRRRSERRRESLPVSVERRQADQRKPKEEIAEVVF